MVRVVSIGNAPERYDGPCVFVALVALVPLLILIVTLAVFGDCASFVFFVAVFQQFVLR